MKILIAGRSGTGKDTLAGRLEKAGLRSVRSYTTRPRRTAKEATHIFITQDQAAELTDRVAETTINGYSYLATRQQVEESDVYIVDPKGVMQLAKAMPDTAFVLVYLTPLNKTLQEEHAVMRADDPQAERSVWEKRAAAEDAEFRQLEEALFDEQAADLPVTPPDNVMALWYTNDYQGTTMDQIAKELYGVYVFWKNMHAMVQKAADADIISRTKDGKIIVYQAGGEDHSAVGVPYSKDRFIRLAYENDELLARLVRSVGSLYPVTIGRKEQ